MLKADAKRIEALAATDEAGRLAAATALQKLKPRHFESHPLDKPIFAGPQLASMVSAWRETQSELVRTWIAQALVLTGTQAPEVLPMVVEALLAPCAYQTYLLGYAAVRHRKMPDGKAFVLGFHRHPDPGMRFAVASNLSGLDLDPAADMPVVRGLMLDASGSVRVYAVRAAMQLEAHLQAADYEVLLDVVNIDCGSARACAHELMQKLEARLPGCTPSAFAPRVPFVRYEGVYRTGRQELDAHGAWISSGCLRFFADGSVHGFGTDVAPVDFDQVLPRAELDVARATVRTDGAHLRFAFDDGFEYDGRIDGDQLQLARRDPASGLVKQETYVHWPVDWHRPAPVPPPGAKKRASKGGTDAFIAPKRRSMTQSDAARWYLQMVARLPGLVSTLPTTAAQLGEAWALKSAMREAAAKASYDPALQPEFFAKMPLPTLDELLAGATESAALQALCTVTQAEVRAFPGTVGEAIGMRIFDVGGKDHVMTGQGWREA